MKNGRQTRGELKRVRRMLEIADAQSAEIRDLKGRVSVVDVRMRDLEEAAKKPIPLILTCPAPTCGARHIDEGEWANRVHHTHSCQICGFTWRPAVVPTVGVQFLPGFKNT